MERSSAEVEPVAGRVYVAEPSFKIHKFIYEKKSSNICPLVLYDSFPQTGEWPLKSAKRTNGDGSL